MDMDVNTNMDILYDYYLPVISSTTIFVLATVAIIVPYVASLKHNKWLPLPISKKSLNSNTFNKKPVDNNPTITQNFWYPLICCLCISIFLYSVVIIRKLQASSHLGTTYRFIGYIIFWGLLSLISGFVIMLNYVELACNMIEFVSIMLLLLVMSVAHWTFNIYSITKNYIRITLFIIITLNILMWLLTSKFHYYIK